MIPIFFLIVESNLHKLSKAVFGVKKKTSKINSFPITLKWFACFVLQTKIITCVYVVPTYLNLFHNLCFDCADFELQYHITVDLTSLFESSRFVVFIGSHRVTRKLANWKIKICFRNAISHLYCIVNFWDTMYVEMIITAGVEVNELYKVERWEPNLFGLTLLNLD